MSCGCEQGRTCPPAACVTCPALDPSTGHAQSRVRATDMSSPWATSGGHGGSMSTGCGQEGTCSMDGHLGVALRGQPGWDMSIPGLEQRTWWRYVHWLRPGEDMLNWRARWALHFAGSQMGHVHSWASSNGHGGAMSIGCGQGACTGHVHWWRAGRACPAGSLSAGTPGGLVLRVLGLSQSTGGEGFSGLSGEGHRRDDHRQHKSPGVALKSAGPGGVAHI